MEQVNEDQSLPRKAPRLVYPPVLEKKSPKPKPVLEYHLMEQKITSAITDFKAGKYASLAEAGRAHGITERAGYFRLRARAAGRASKSDRIKNGSQRLSPEQEIILCQFVDGLEDIPALHRTIGEKAYSMLCEDLAADDPPPRPLGKQWPARFLERHPGIQARRPKPLTSPTHEQSAEGTDPSIPRQEILSGKPANEEPQLLRDCHEFLDRSADADDTPDPERGVSTLSLEVPAVSITTGQTTSVERTVSSPTATPPDRPSISSSSIDCFFSAIKISLAEQKMTFAGQLTR